MECTTNTSLPNSKNLKLLRDAQLRDGLKRKLNRRASLVKFLLSVPAFPFHPECLAYSKPKIRPHRHGRCHCLPDHELNTFYRFDGGGLSR